MLHLINVNVQNFETSPAYETLKLIEKFTRIMAYVLPICLLIFIGLIFRYQRKRKKT